MAGAGQIEERKEDWGDLQGTLSASLVTGSYSPPVGKWADKSSREIRRTVASKLTGSKSLDEAAFAQASKPIAKPVQALAAISASGSSVVGSTASASEGVVIPNPRNKSSALQYHMAQMAAAATASAAAIPSSATAPTSTHPANK